MESSSSDEDGPDNGSILFRCDEQQAGESYRASADRSQLREADILWQDMSDYHYHTHRRNPY